MFGQRNRLFGWSLFLAGVVYGMVLGTFAFGGPLDAPDRFADYASVPRRMIRLAHIACMALGIVNVIYGQEIDRLRLSERWRRMGSRQMITAGALMPVILTLSAYQHAFHLLLAIPATAAFIGIVVVIVGLRKGVAS